MSSKGETAGKMLGTPLRVSATILYTGGVCPSCLQQWASTQCLSCKQWSPPSDWYAHRQSDAFTPNVLTSENY